MVIYSALGNDFLYNRGTCFWKTIVFSEEQSRKNLQICAQTRVQWTNMAVIFGIQNEDKLFQSLEPNCVSKHTHAHKHTHTLHPTPWIHYKSHADIQYEHKGILQLTNGPQVNPKSLFHEQWPPMIILAPETRLKGTAVIWFHNMQHTHTHTRQVSLPAVLSPTIERGDNCSHSIVLLCN